MQSWYHFGSRFLDTVDRLPPRERVKLIRLLMWGVFVLALAGGALYAYLRVAMHA